MLYQDFKFWYSTKIYSFDILPRFEVFMLYQDYKYWCYTKILSFDVIPIF